MAKGQKIGQVTESQALKESHLTQQKEALYSEILPVWVTAIETQRVCFIQHRYALEKMRKQVEKGEIIPLPDSAGVVENAQTKEELIAHIDLAIGKTTQLIAECQEFLDKQNQTGQVFSFSAGVTTTMQQIATLQTNCRNFAKEQFNWFERLVGATYKFFGGSSQNPLIKPTFVRVYLAAHETSDALSALLTVPALQAIDMSFSERWHAFFHVQTEEDLLSPTKTFLPTADDLQTILATHAEKIQSIVAQEQDSMGARNKSRTQTLASIASTKVDTRGAPGESSAVLSTEECDQALEVSKKYLPDQRQSLCLDG